jgi:hypothetical protein
MKVSPAELPLTLSADVLRLPYPLPTRLVLAEISSLYSANRGCCDCSDAHLAARLTISKDTVSVAIQLLVKDGLLMKQVNKAAGFYRTLAPVTTAIEAKAATNPYPEIPGRRTIRKNLVDHPEIPAPPTRKNPILLSGDSETNTHTLNLPVEPSIELSSAPHMAAGAEKKITVPELKKVTTPTERPGASASHTGGAGHGAQPREPAAFVAFYNAYPRREKRKEALAAFRKLHAVDQQAACDRATAWFAARPDLLDPGRLRYIPLPASWLNAARWTDEQPSNLSPLSTSAHVTPSHGRPRPGFHSKDLDFGDILAANAYLASATGHSQLRQPCVEPDASESFAIQLSIEAV